jgi:hypothetical protein
MSAYRTAEEVKRHHIEVLGEELGSLYHALWNELAWLYSKWDEYVELFGSKPSRIELINKAAGHFFKIVQDSLWEDSLLHIARLTDPSKSAGRENLTIKKLPGLITDETFKKHLSELVVVAVEKADFCRDWRNRHIAHKDLGLAMKTGAEPLKAASRAKVKEVLSAISDVLNAVSGHYMDSTTAFEGIGGSGGAVSLLYVLDDGIRTDEERNERRKVGNYRAEDYQSRDI